jgi:DNA-binding transcriptional MocR family regulator
MDKEGPRNEVRRMDSGSWYWVSKAVIQKYASKVGFLPIAVYHFLASMTDENQSCYPSQRYIAERLGCSRSSVSRAIKKLKVLKFIALTRGINGNYTYRLLDTKNCTDANKMSHECNQDVAPVDTNNTTLTRISNNTFVGVSSKKLLNGRPPETKEELLALNIAEMLDDQRSIGQYLSYARKYPESVLREFLSQAQQTPSHIIRKSRAALFAYLVKQYDQQTS